LNKLTEKESDIKTENINDQLVNDQDEAIQLTTSQTSEIRLVTKVFSWL
jgi:hypothetical protein